MAKKIEKKGLPDSVRLLLLRAHDKPDSLELRQEAQARIDALKASPEAFRKLKALLQSPTPEAEAAVVQYYADTLILMRAKLGKDKVSLKAFRDILEKLVAGAKVTDSHTFNSSFEVGANKDLTGVPQLLFILAHELGHNFHAELHPMDWMAADRGGEVEVIADTFGLAFMEAMGMSDEIPGVMRAYVKPGAYPGREALRNELPPDERKESPGPGAVAPKFRFRDLLDAEVAVLKEDAAEPGLRSTAFGVEEFLNLVRARLPERSALRAPYQPTIYPYRFQKESPYFDPARRDGFRKAGCLGFQPPAAVEDFLKAKGLPSDARTVSLVQSLFLGVPLSEPTLVDRVQKAIRENPKGVKVGVLDSTVGYVESSSIELTLEFYGYPTDPATIERVRSRFFEKEVGDLSDEDTLRELFGGRTRRR